VRAGGAAALVELWPAQTLEAWAYILGFGLMQAALLLLVPGGKHVAPTTPKGNTPVYRVRERFFVCVVFLRVCICVIARTCARRILLLGGPVLPARRRRQRGGGGGGRQAVHA
jgi:hypothetical protein